MELKFKRDTSFRKQFFVPDSFAHPAKMDAQLLIWLVERYTKPGEVILDPMAGMGTTMLACTLGRNMVLVELEEKFCKMCKSNWEKVSAMPQLGYEMGQCNIIQGDARRLEGLLVDKCIFSPPFAEQPQPSRTNHGILNHKPDCKCNFCRKNRGNKGAIQGYRQVDKIVTSPPYAEAHDTKNLGVGDGDRADLRAYSWLKEDNPNNIGNLPYGQIDKIVTSPPFQEPEIRRSGQAESREGYNYGSKLKMSSEHPDNISKSAERNYGNIDNLKSDSYLEAMLQVYRSCFAVLKPQGLMVLVTKNFIRDKQVVRLDEDTIKLCEEVGFAFVERHYRKLTHQSFWRVIYHQKHPEVEQIKSEDILVFQRSKGER